VHEQDHRVPFAVNGTFNKMTVDLEFVRLMAEDQEKAARVIGVAKELVHPSCVASSRVSSRADERGSDARAQPGGGWSPRRRPAAARRSSAARSLKLARAISTAVAKLIASRAPRPAV